ncbi:MAG: DUF6460 domain-containing protein [Hyphomicrobiaceae bacterium]
MDQRDFTGTSVAGIALRLAVISLVVGVVLSALGINANNLFSSLNMLARRIYDLGFGSIEWLAQYMIVGAMVVVPIWLAAWFLGGLRTRRD